MLKSVVMAYHFIGPDGPTDNKFCEQCLFLPWTTKVWVLWRQKVNMTERHESDPFGSLRLCHSFSPWGFQVSSPESIHTFRRWVCRFVWSNGYKRYYATWCSIGYDFQLYPKWGEVELQHKYQILVAVNPIASFISAPLGGYLSSKLGRARPLLVAALVVLVASNILYSTVSVTTQQYRYPLLLVARIATGISSGKS